jgi:non-specific serine/threonine protein kinase
MKTIGRELDVQYVLEGSVRKAGNNLRITAQLIDATTDAHLWAEKYGGTLDDVFDIQERVSRSIVESLQLELSPEVRQRMEKRPFDNLQAYEYWLRARYEIYQWTEEHLENAVSFLKEGLKIMGENAALFAAMGSVYFQFFNSGIRSDPKILDEAEGYVKKAFRLDPSSSIGHYAMGAVFYLKGQIKESIHHFTEAITLNPNHSDSMRILSYIYAILSGNTEKGKQLSQKAIELDPLFPVNHATPAFIYWSQGKLEPALEACEKYYQMAPKNIHAQLMYSLFLIWNRRYDEAFLFIMSYLKYAIQNKKNEALQALTEDQITFARNHSFYSWIMAQGNALLMRKGEALDWLENAVGKGWRNYLFLSKIDPFIENIRGEERFKKLMERVKTEWESFEAQKN